MRSRYLGEVFAVTYPSGRAEKYTLHILARAGKHQEVGLVLDSLEEVADAVTKAIKGEYSQVFSKAEPVGQEARRLLNFAAESLAAQLEGVPMKDLESVFGGHGFFHNVLEGQLPKEKREQTLRLGAAFLFVNQVLFYTLLSKENIEHGIASFPPLTHEIAEQPERIQELFDAVYEKDYEPIYGINITQFMKDQGARDACRGGCEVDNCYGAQNRRSGLGGSNLPNTNPIRPEEATGCPLHKPWCRQVTGPTRPSRKEREGPRPSLWKRNAPNRLLQEIIPAQSRRKEE